MKLLIATLFSALIIISASAQTIEFVRPEHDISGLLSIKHQQNLERSLEKQFPLRTLRHRTQGSGKISAECITYDIIKQHGKKYAVVIFTGSWKLEASQLAIFRIDGGGYPNTIYRSYCWHSNFSDSYHEIQSIMLGKENVILIKEGEMGSSPFALASVFTFREKHGDEDHPGYFFINDLTPKMPRLKAYAGFPMKALYAQAVKLQKNSERVILQAADVEFSWTKSKAEGMNFWSFEKYSRRFVPVNSPFVQMTEQ